MSASSSCHKSDSACGCHSHSHHGSDCRKFPFLREFLTASLLIVALIISHFQLLSVDASPIVRYCVMALPCFIAILPVAIPVVKDGARLWMKGDFLNEYSLMIAATIGAFALGEFYEGVAILLFYSFGEKLEERASDKARDSIKKLFGHLPDMVDVVEDNTLTTMKVSDVMPGTDIFVRPGNRVPIDSILADAQEVSFDASALTGESVPIVIASGQEVEAGLIPVDKAVRLTAVRKFTDSSFTRIMTLIERAVENQAPTETMLRRITRWYTPVVFVLAILLTLVPFLISLINPGFSYHFSEWFQRSLVFLVCSCPCALVVSIPLSYFSGIGRASANGLLFKGAKYIDALSNIQTVVFDKTGTLTTGEFRVEKVCVAEGHTPEEIISIAAAIDYASSHPLAKAIVKDAGNKRLRLPETHNVTSIGHGMVGYVNDNAILLGSPSLMDRNDIRHPEGETGLTEICVAINNIYVGSIYLADTVKKEASECVRKLRKAGIKNISVLSGDRQDAVARVASLIGADSWQSSLLPEEKQKIVEREETSQNHVMFVGDGVNDAPSLASASIGVAMGTRGSDIAMESANVVIAGDNLLKIPEAFSLASRIKSVVKENIIFAFGVKGLVLTLGAVGIASLWAAVFADTGVTLCTVAWTLWRLRKG